jgi:NADH dehydrogenase
MDSPTKNNIVIVGGGFGGIRAALALGRMLKRDKALAQENEITLIDQKNYHLFTPALYEIAAARRRDAAAFALKSAVAIPFETIFRNLPIAFAQGRITRIELEPQELFFADGARLPWHILVLAPGAETNFFNLPGVREESIAFKGLEDAVQIRNTLAERFDMALGARRPCRVVIGGAGLTGVELAGEITSYLTKLARMRPRYQRKAFKHPFRVILVEGAHDILPGFQAPIIAWTKKRLFKIGVEIKTGQRITRATAMKIILEKEELAHDVFIWAGGVKTHTLLGHAAFEHDAGQHLLVDDHLRARFDAKRGGESPIYVVGDGCCFVSPGTNQPLPGMALVAEHQGSYAADAIYARLYGKIPRPYIPPRIRFVMPIGSKWAIADLGFIRMKGFSGWILKQLVMLKHLTSVLPWWRGARMWLKAVLIFSRND